MRIYEYEDAKAHCTSVKEQEKILQMLQTFRFMENFKHYTKQDQQDLAQSFEKVILMPGDRVYTNFDKLDSFNIILKGKIGVFFVEQTKMKALQATPGRVVSIT